MAKHEKYERDDNPIDWSAFSEAPGKPLHLKWCTQLRWVSFALIALAIAGIVFGANMLVSAFNALAESGDGAALFVAHFGDYWRPVFIMLIGLVTLIPATFGLQTAQAPGSFVAPTVLGLAGIAAPLVFVMVLVAFGLLNGGIDIVLLVTMLICAVAASVYLLFVVRVHKSFNAATGGVHTAKRSTKDEMWDEDKIWN